MKRAHIVIVLAVLAFAIALAAVVVLPRYAAMVASRAYSDLVVCLAGPERMPPEEAAVRARRIHVRPASLAACAAIAPRADSWWIRRYEPRFASAASSARIDLDAGHVPDVAALVASGAALAWTPSIAGTAAPKPLLDREIVELRKHPPTIDAAPMPALPPELAGREARACRRQKGHAIAVATASSITVYALADSLVRWGDVAIDRVDAPMSNGPWSLACTEDAAQIAYAIADPATKRAPLSGTSDPVPEEPNRHHRVVVATCAASGCTRREADVRGIDAGWGTTGGFGSEWAMLAPDVMAVGDRVFFVWRTGRAILFRFAALDALDAAPSEWLAEMDRSESGDPDPRRVAWPELRLRADAGDARLRVSESRTSSSFLFRIDRKVDLIVP